MLVWMTQLGLSVAAPLVCYTGLAVWLRSRFGLGVWVIFVGLALGLYSAVEGFVVSLRMMERMDKSGKDQSASGRTDDRRGIR